MSFPSWNISFFGYLRNCYVGVSSVFLAQYECSNCMNIFHSTRCVSSIPVLLTLFFSRTTNWSSRNPATHLRNVIMKQGTRAGADPGIYFLGGAKPRSPIESWGRSPNRGREGPEYRGRSPSRGREAPENWGRSPNRGRSPRKSGGRGLGRGLGEPLPRKFLKNQTWNHSFWCIFEAIIWND